MKDLTKGKPSTLILAFALPIFLGNLLQLTYSVTDTRIVGSFLGEDALAAVGATTTLSNLIIGFLLGLANGFAIITAQRFGAKDIRGVKKSFAASLVLGTVISVVLTVLGLTGYLREWEKQLRERCGYRFFSGNNLEVFLADCGSVRQLLLMADGMLCGIREKYDAAALEEFASGLGAGENRLLYQKAVTRLFKERYKEKEDPWIKLWKQDLEAGTILQSCPGAVCARYEQAVSGLLYDASCDMFYVMIDGKPLYYPQEFSDEQVLERYRKLCEEQDRESAHCYRNGNLQIPDGAVIMDAGAAEGYFALTVIEHAGRVYLTDRDERWNAAWQKTFAPYRDKVVFLHGVLGGSEAGCDVMTIDDIIGTGRLDFLKVDVGGAEQEVLLGAQKVLGNAAAMRCVVAAYHTHESEAQIADILRENGFQTDRADGYFLHMDYEKPVWENELRHALVWAERN